MKSKPIAMGLSVLFLALVAILGVVQLSANDPYSRHADDNDPFGLVAASEEISFSRLRACSELAPGVNPSDLAQLFGPPTGMEGEWSLYLSDSLASGPIRAKIDPSTRKVTALRCGEDGPITWQIP